MQRANAQLRPLEPTDFRALSGDDVQVEFGGGYYTHQRAALAGVEGRLIELANFRAHFRTGRAILELGGTIQRLFHEESRFAQPYADAAQSTASGNRHDAGDYRVGAIFELVHSKRFTGLLRFGTRLPTTDNLVGLDRDAIDFYATLNASKQYDEFFGGLEAGLGINGTRSNGHEQSDVLLYSITLASNQHAIAPFLILAGQEDLHPGGIRGNEDLGEIRGGVRFKETISAAAVIGYREYSPDWGIQLSVRKTF
jgi:hypothetical protein